MKVEVVLVEGFGLVLEGGGSRGTYTAGVLDAFIENKIEIPYVIGVSIGAYNGASYISKQIGRNYRVFSNYINDKRFLDFSRVLKGGKAVNSRFVFDYINRLGDPFDYNKFFGAGKKFIVVGTNCLTGEAVYFDRDCLKGAGEIDEVIRASCSLPFVTDVVNFKNMELLDGGISDSIPFLKAFLDGNRKIIVVLTHPKDYEEPKGWYHLASSLIYKKYPKLTNALKERAQNYNESVLFLELLEKIGKAYIIRPAKMEVSILDKDRKNMKYSYDTGYNQVLNEIYSIKKFLGIPGGTGMGELI